LSFKDLYLRRRAPLPPRQLLHLLHNRLVPVEILALEFRHRAPEIVGREVVGRGVVEVVDEPAVAEGRVGDVCYAELLCRGDEAVGFVQRFEGGVFGLDGVDFGDWGCGLAHCNLMTDEAEVESDGLTFIRSSEGLG